MRPTIEEIKAAIVQEGSRHGLTQESLRLDIRPAVVVPGHIKGFRHEIACKCGQIFELSTMHSAQTPNGAQELNAALGAEIAAHALQSSSEMIYRLHDLPN